MHNAKETFTEWQGNFSSAPKNASVIAGLEKSKILKCLKQIFSFFFKKIDSKCELGKERLKRIEIRA